MRLEPQHEKAAGADPGGLCELPSRELATKRAGCGRWRKWWISQGSRGSGGSEGASCEPAAGARAETLRRGGLSVGYLIVAPSTAVLVPPPCWVKRGRTASFCGLSVKRLSVLR